MSASPGPLCLEIWPPDVSVFPARDIRVNGSRSQSPNRLALVQRRSFSHQDVDTRLANAAAQCIARVSLLFDHLLQVRSVVGRSLDYSGSLKALPLLETTQGSIDSLPEQFRPVGQLLTIIGARMAYRGKRDLVSMVKQSESRVLLCWEDGQLGQRGSLESVSATVLMLQLLIWERAANVSLDASGVDAISLGASFQHAYSSMLELCAHVDPSLPIDWPRAWPMILFFHVEFFLAELGCVPISTRTGLRKIFGRTWTRECCDDVNPPQIDDYISWLESEPSKADFWIRSRAFYMRTARYASQHVFSIGARSVRFDARTFDICARPLRWFLQDHLDNGYALVKAGYLTITAASVRKAEPERTDLVDVSAQYVSFCRTALTYAA